MKNTTQSGQSDERLMNRPVSLIRAQVIDGVAYELYRQTAQPGMVIRVRDIEAGETVSIMAFEDADQADYAYRNTIRILTT